MIKKLVSFAVLLQDDFTGADIPDDGFQFWLDSRRAAPIKKTEGFYVFVGVPGEEWILTVAGAHYSPRTVKFSKAFLNPASPVMILRLFRRAGMYFSDCVELCGNHRCGEMVFALGSDSPPLRLHALEAKGGAAQLTLMGYTPRPLLRHRFCLGLGKTRELFVITAKEKDGSYLCDQPFRYSHGEGEPILRAWGAVCDPQGRFSISIESEMKDSVETIEEYNEEVRQWGCSLQTVPN
ncbi:MAG: hypothetical protein RR315_00285 [Oscillospiraceae bacterium]